MRRTTGSLIAAAIFALVLWTYVHRVGFTNDHFDRVSRGQQIYAWGDVPFRDFFDPGYFLALYSSAAMQALFGHNLFGEALLTAGRSPGGSRLRWCLRGGWPARGGSPCR